MDTPETRPSAALDAQSSSAAKNIMDDLETQSAAPAAGSLQQQLDSLRHLVISVLVLAIIISGVLNLFLLRQAKYTRADLAAIRPQVTQMVAEYNKNNAPLINEFVKKLVDFGQKNADFAPILAKYGLVKPAGPTSPAPATAPAVPAPKTPAPAPKK